MQADAGKALCFLPLGKVRIDRLLQSGIARIALGCGMLILVVPALAVR